MDTVGNKSESQCNNTLDTHRTQHIKDDDDDEHDGVWQDLIGIAPDPPDRRKKCDKCQ